MNETRQLLADYVKTGSDTAFAELVRCYIGLVYAAALRLVDGDTHLAQDISQKVFADLARNAKKLSPDVMLGGWLHRHTCFVGAAAMRAERRRVRRERVASEMNATEDHSAENLASIAPALDDAVNELGPEDRTAVLLRFFEKRDFHTIGLVLGSTDDAARKRLHRALDKLQALLARRGVALSATALAAALSSNLVTAAPAGLALTVSTAALATAATGTASTILNIMSMTKLKTAAVCAVMAVGVTVPLLMQHREKLRLQHEAAVMAKELAVLTQELEAARERSPLTHAPITSPTPEQIRELMRLRGEVGRLRTENAAVSAANAGRTNSSSPLESLLSDPAMQNTFVEQQKMAIRQCYNEVTNRINLVPEQRDKLIDMVASSFMENVRLSAAMVREGKSTADAEPIFAAREQELRAGLQAMLGSDGLAQYDDFTQNLTTHFTVLEFAEKLSGTAAEKAGKAALLRQAMQDESALALAAAGLGADFQTLPRLNFRNLVSEQDAERGLRVLDTIYAGVSARASEFMSPDEQDQFAQFRAHALKANRLALLTARKVMAPTR